MRDLYREVTDRIITALEAGTPPWVRPWSGDTEAFPVNVATDRPYRGVNVMLLTLEAQLRGFSRHAWLTYRQAGELGAQVRGGERGTTVVFYKLTEYRRETETESREETRAPRLVPLLRAFTVFNVAQVDGLPGDIVCPLPAAPWDPHEAVEALVVHSGATLEHGGLQACYQPSRDLIRLPEPGLFEDRGAYYSTLLHELAHWTGHPSRCDRNLSGRFGDDAYAMEELIAEIGSAFLCAHCGLDGRLQHASYVASWLKVLKADKRAVFTAASKAQAAADFLLRIDPDAARAAAA